MNCRSIVQCCGQVQCESTDGGKEMRQDNETGSRDRGIEMAGGFEPEVHVISKRVIHDCGSLIAK